MATFRGLDILGARPAAAKREDVSKRTPKGAPKTAGQKPAPIVYRRGTARENAHATALHNAQQIALRTADVARRVLSQAKAQKPSKPVAAMTVQRAGSKTVVGVARPLTAQQKAKVGRHIAMARKAALAVDQAKIAAKRAQDAATLLDATRKKALGRIRPILAPAARATVRGVEVIGADPDPSNPGFLTDGSIDPAFAAADTTQPGTGGIDPTAWGLPPNSPLFTDASGANPDPNLRPVPVRGQALDLSAARQPWREPPADAVWYDYATVPYNSEDASVGSVNFFLSNGADGFIFSRAANAFNPFMGGAGQGNRDVNRSERDLQLQFGIADSDIPRQLGTGGDTINNRVSMAFGWGPLVGAPGKAWSGLQMAANGMWFWLPENAPDWATRDADRALRELNAKMLEADNAAINALNADNIREAYRRADEQARQDAADALAEKETQRAAAKMELEQQRADLEQQRATLQQEQAESGIAQQAAQQELREQAAAAEQQRQAQAMLLDYLRAHPEEMEAAAAEAGEMVEEAAPDEEADASAVDFGAAGEGFDFGEIEE